MQLVDQEEAMEEFELPKHEVCKKQCSCTKPLLSSPCVLYA